MRASRGLRPSGRADHESARSAAGGTSRPVSPVGRRRDSNAWTACCWSGVGSAILYKVVDIIVGLRPSVEAEREGLDITDHGERAYNI